MKKKLSALTLSSVLLLSLVACGNNSTTSESSSDMSSSSSSVSASQSAPAQSQETSTDTVNEEVLNDISVEMEPDSALSQAIVTITNNSPMTFDGNVSVYFENASGDSVGDDMIFVTELVPGDYTYARIDVDETENITMDYNISSPEFSEAPSSEGGVLDEEASASLAEEFELSFGGAGNPEWATSWYKYVSKIEVFTADSSYAVITVTADADSESIDRIGTTIFANYADDFNLSRVLVVDDTGSTLFDRAL